MSLYLKIANRIIKRKDPLFAVDIDKQITYMKSLGLPADDYARSYFQYKCQMYLIGFWNKLWYNLVSLPLLIFYIFKINGNGISFKSNIDTLMLFPYALSVVPKSITDKNSYFQFPEYEKHMCLNSDDKRFIRNIYIKYPFSFHFILKCMLKIAMYRYIIDTWNPKSIVVTSEYSFTSSILTAYCDMHNVKHVNIMHGEKMLYIRDTFFRFHECYVWDEFYIKLFTKLNAYTGQFRVEKPPSQLPWNIGKIDKIVDYTYYLSGEDEHRLVSIREYLDVLRKNRLKVTVRPHPIDRDMEIITKVFSNYIIQNCKDVSIEQSVMESRYVISFYSTVLLQAYINGVDIVIDDLTDTNRFEILKKLDYRMLDVKHIKLSELIEKYE